MNIKKHVFKNKNFKPGYYLKVAANALIPAIIFKIQKKKLLKNSTAEDKAYIEERVHYYNKLSKPVSIANHPQTQTIKTLKRPKKSKVYFFDILKYLKYFPSNLHFIFKPGDNIDILSAPSFVKSRPINGSSNEVLLKLVAIRHFNFIHDDIPFANKKNILFGRLAVYQDIRKRFYTQHFNNPFCDLGDVAKGTQSNWLKPKVSITHHLQYKFILALEGNDVATNLKWIMSSNSIAVMPMPRYETWFMEGKLIPNVHFICIKDDFSDINERLEYYINNEVACLEIIKNANEWVAQFKNKKRELLLNILVMEKYFELTQ